MGAAHWGRVIWLRFGASVRFPLRCSDDFCGGKSSRRSASCIPWLDGTGAGAGSIRTDVDTMALGAWSSAWRWARYERGARFHVIGFFESCSVDFFTSASSVSRRTLRPRQLFCSACGVAGWAPPRGMRVRPGGAHVCLERGVPASRLVLLKKPRASFSSAS